MVSIECDACRTSRPVMRPLQRVTVEDARCDGCGQLARPNTTHQVDSDSSWTAHTLQELGVPPYEWVRLEVDAQQYVIALDGDRQSVMG